MIAAVVWHNNEKQEDEGEGVIKKRRKKNFKLTVCV